MMWLIFKELSKPFAHVKGNHGDQDSWIRLYGSMVLFKDMGIRECFYDAHQILQSPQNI